MRPFIQHAPGLFLVRYDASEDLQPAKQADLVKALEAVPVPLPVAIVFALGPGVRGVDMDVPTFWLSVTGRRELRLRAMGIVTDSIAVKVAVQGFALANGIRGQEIAVKSFHDAELALEWAREELEKAAQAA